MTAGTHTCSVEVMGICCAYLGVGTDGRGDLEGDRATQDEHSGWRGSNIFCHPTFLPPFPRIQARI